MWWWQSRFALLSRFSSATSHDNDKMRQDLGLQDPLSMSGGLRGPFSGPGSCSCALFQPAKWVLWHESRFAGRRLVTAASHTTDKTRQVVRSHCMQRDPPRLQSTSHPALRHQSNNPTIHKEINSSSEYSWQFSVIYPLHCDRGALCGVWCVKGVANTNYLFSVPYHGEYIVNQAGSVVIQSNEGLFVQRLWVTIWRFTSRIAPKSPAVILVGIAWSHRIRVVYHHQHHHR